MELPGPGEIVGEIKGDWVIGDGDCDIGEGDCVPVDGQFSISLIIPGCASVFPFVNWLSKLSKIELACVDVCIDLIALVATSGSGWIIRLVIMSC